MLPFKTSILNYVLSLCLIWNAFSQTQAEYHLKDLNLNGKVHKMVESAFSVIAQDDQIPKKGLLFQDIYLYNPDGFLLEKIHSKSDQILWRDIHNYDQNNNRIEEYRHHGDGELIYKNTYKYDSFGNQIEKIAFDSKGKKEFKIVNSYDEKGRLVAIHRIDVMGNEKVIKKNTYDGKGNLAEEIMYDLLGHPMKILNTYDSHGHIIKSELYNSKKKLEEKQTFKYDIHGNLIEDEIANAPDFSSIKTLYAYNSRSDMLEKSRFQSNGELLEQDVYEFKYDEIGNLIKETHRKFYRGTKSTQESFEYSKFDDYGNWRKKFYFKEGKIQTVVEREIEFHL